jgi:hypothetical protein
VHRGGTGQRPGLSASQRRRRHGGRRTS